MQTKEEILQEAKLVTIVELCSIPLFLFTYTDDKTFFWIILILLDSFLIKHLHIMEFGKLSESIQKKEIEPIVILNIGVILGYTVVAFKNFPLAIYLIINDIVMDAISVFIYIQKQNKDDKA